MINLKQRLGHLLKRSKNIVVPYSEEHAAAQADFAHKAWPGKRRRADPMYLRWKFRGPSQGPVDNLLLARIGSNVVGQVGLMPAQLHCGGRTYSCYWIADLMVMDQIPGIGPMLLAAALDREGFFLGSNPSPPSLSLLRGLGFQSVPGPVSFLYPLRAEHVLSMKIPARYAFARKVAAAIANPLFRVRRKRQLRMAKAESVSDVAWNEMAPTVQKWQRQLCSPHIVHDENFLNWRCAGIPTFSNTLNALRTGRGGYAFTGAGLPYYYVFDWAATDLDDCRDVLMRCTQQAEKANASTLIVEANSSQEESWLTSVGLFRMRQPRQIIGFHPDVALDERFHFSSLDCDVNL